MGIHVFTSATSSYLPKARVLARSVKALYPQFLFHLVLVDAIPDWLRIEDEPFDSLISALDLDLGPGNPDQWLFQHSIVEACTGVKGPALLHLLERDDVSAVLYFDPDIVLLGRLEQLLGEFETASILLTPHLTEPEKTLEAILDNEVCALQHGICNLGFLGVRNSPEGRRFAHWWADRLQQFCYDDIPGGLFTDQRWADLAPSYFEGVRVLRNPEYNVCTWNLTHRDVSGSMEKGLTVNGRPLVFYHFSGLDSGAQEVMLEKYGSAMPALHELRAWYLAECDRLGQRELGATPWSYGVFDNGQPVTALHRKTYRERADLRQAFPHPYATAEDGRSYYHWFAINAQSGAAPQPASAPPADAAPGPGLVRPDAPDYRIFLSVGGAQPGDVVRAARELKARSFRARSLYAIGEEAAIGLLLAEEDLREDFRCLTLSGPFSHERAFERVASEYGGTADFLFVTADVSVPALWDLRLAWTARRTPGIASVSPMNDGAAHTRLHSGQVIAQSVDEIDAACHRHSWFLNPEIPALLGSCVYVNHEAIRDAGAAGPLGFAARSAELRWSHVVADHVYTRGAALPAAVGPSPEPLPALVALRNRVAESWQRGEPRTPAQPKRRHLHIMHSWGGGAERWVREYGRADGRHENLVLKSAGPWGSFGAELQLYQDVSDVAPLRTWSISPVIKHTAEIHARYRAALAEVVGRYGIDVVLVSSLIGHSLDALRTGLPTILVCHDYYPFCPALFATFGDKVCSSCDRSDLQRCASGNVHHRVFQNLPSSAWLNLRPEFVRAVAGNGVRMIAPSPSVRDIYSRLLPEIRPHFHVIPHGASSFGISTRPLDLRFEANRRLRIVVLGSMAPQKGLDLLRSVLPDLLSIADVHLVGCGDYGQEFIRSGVAVVPAYKLDELPAIMRSIQPDLGLLLSVVPETFSYTLHELFELAIPPVATRIGSFADRIEDGVNGFLVESLPGAVVDRLRKFAADPAPLDCVHRRLKANPPRSAEAMLAEYEIMIDLPDLSERAYFASNRAGRETGDRPSMLWSQAEHYKNLSEERRQRAEDAEIRLRESSSRAEDAEIRLRESSSRAEDAEIRLRESASRAEDAEIRLHEAAAQADNYKNLLDEQRQRAQDAETRLHEAAAQAENYKNLLDEQRRRAQDAETRLHEAAAQAEHYKNLLDEQRQRAQDAENRLEQAAWRAECYKNASEGQRQRAEAAETRLREAASQDRIGEMERSISWRATRPLRAVGGPLIKAWQRIRNGRSVPPADPDKAGLEP
ncbi:MAG: glycosyltransferase [Bryobacteraceae bacterium]